MAARMTGWAMLCSSSVQEAHDLALIAQSATLAVAHSVRALLRRIPDLARGQQNRGPRRRRREGDDRRRAGVRASSPRAESGSPGGARRRTEPRRVLPGARDGEPVLRSAAGRRAGRDGSVRSARPDASTGCSTTSARPMRSACSCMMGSGVETAREAIELLNGRGAKLGVVQVHLFRPFSVDDLLATLSRRPRAPSPCSIARKSLVRRASPCIRTW